MTLTCIERNCGRPQCSNCPRSGGDQHCCFCCTDSGRHLGCERKRAQELQKKQEQERLRQEEKNRREQQERRERADRQRRVEHEQRMKEAKRKAEERRKREAIIAENEQKIERNQDRAKRRAKKEDQQRAENHQRTFNAARQQQGQRVNQIVIGQLVQTQQQIIRTRNAVPVGGNNSVHGFLDMPWSASVIAKQNTGSRKTRNRNALKQYSQMFQGNPSANRAETSQSARATELADANRTKQFFENAEKHLQKLQTEFVQSKEHQLNIEPMEKACEFYKSCFQGVEDDSFTGNPDGEISSDEELEVVSEDKGLELSADERLYWYDGGPSPDEVIQRSKRNFLRKVRENDLFDLKHLTGNCKTWQDDLNRQLKDMEEKLKDANEWLIEKKEENGGAQMFQSELERLEKDFIQKVQSLCTMESKEKSLELICDHLDKWITFLGSESNDLGNDTTEILNGLNTVYKEFSELLRVLRSVKIEPPTNQSRAESSKAGQSKDESSEDDWKSNIHRFTDIYGKRIFTYLYSNEYFHDLQMINTFENNVEIKEEIQEPLERICWHIEKWTNFLRSESNDFGGDTTEMLNGLNRAYKKSSEILQVMRPVKNEPPTNQSRAESSKDESSENDWKPSNDSYSYLCDMIKKFNKTVEVKYEKWLERIQWHIIRRTVEKWNRSESNELGTAATEMLNGLDRNYKKFSELVQVLRSVKIEPPTNQSRAESSKDESSQDDWKPSNDADDQRSFKDLCDMIEKFSGPLSTNGKLDSVNGSFKQWLSDTFETVKEKIALFSPWNKSDVSKFLTELKENASKDKSILLKKKEKWGRRVEWMILIIAVVARANEICTGFKQRNNQILALLLRIIVYLWCPEMRGLVMQVDTGQGKSIIIAVSCAVLAIWKSLEKAAENPNQDEAEGDELKNKVLIGVMTCNPLLARRDADEQRDFFEMLGLTVDHLSYEHHEEDKIKNAYATADVVYAHMYDCLSHAALDEFYGRDIRGGRTFDHLFIDENDFEQNDNVTRQNELRIAHIVPGMEWINIIFLIMSCLRDLLINQVVEKLTDEKKAKLRAEKNFKLTTEQRKDMKEKLVQLVNHLVDGSSDTESNFKKIVDNAFASDSNAHPEEKKCQIQFGELMDQLPAKIPEFLKEYARKEAERWADSAINALSLVDRVQFIRQSANGSRTDLIPVDNENTGIVEQNTQWEDGLHQLVQILQFVLTTLLTMQSATKDNLCFIRDQKEVTGITGTIGNENERKFIEETFNVLTIVVPPFAKPKLERLADIIVDTIEEKHQAILDMIRKRNAKQPALVVCGSVREAEQIIKKIEMDLQHIKIRKLLKGDEVEEDPGLIKNPIGPGEIMVATKLGCRGMDLKCQRRKEDDTLEAGGLLTINATASETPRNETQTVGRSGRKGEPGEGITIVCIPDLEALLDQSLAGQSKEKIGQNWRKIRDERIAKNLDSFSKHRVDPLLLRAELYGEMCKEMKIFREMCINADYTEFALLQIEQHWAFWIKEAARSLDDEINKAIKESPEKHASEIVGPMKDGLSDEFREFIKKIKQNLEQFIKDPEKLDLFENPAYVVKTADYFLRNDNPKRAESMLTTAFNMDKVFGAYALYYRALSHIEQGHKLFKKNNKSTKKNGEYHQKAKADLSTAICLVQDMIYYINGASITIQRPTSELAMQYNRKVELLNAFQHSCQKAISVIDNVDQNKPECVAKREAYVTHDSPSSPPDPDPAGGSPHPKSPKDGKNNSSDQGPSPFEVKIPFDEINEMKDSGFPHFFELGVAAPKPPWWSIIILAVVGIMQICLGAMLAVCSGGLATRFAWTSIQSGFSDMVTAIKEAIDGIRGCTEGAFSWMKWLGRKSIEYGGALLGHVAKFLGTKSSVIAKTNKLIGIGQAVDQTPARKIIFTVAKKTFESKAIGFGAKIFVDGDTRTKKLENEQFVINAIGTCTNLFSNATTFGEILRNSKSEAVKFVGDVAVEKLRVQCMEFLHKKVTNGTNLMEEGFLKELIIEGTMEFGNIALNGGSKLAEIVVHECVDKFASGIDSLIDNSKSKRKDDCKQQEQSQNDGKAKPSPGDENKNDQDKKETDGAEKNEAQDGQNGGEAKPSLGGENKNDQDEKEAQDGQNNGEAKPSSGNEIKTDQNEKGTDRATKNKDQQSSNDEKTSGTKKVEDKADQQSSSNGQPSENTDGTKKRDQQSSKKGLSSENAKKIEKTAKDINSALNTHQQVLDAKMQEAENEYNGLVLQNPESLFSIWNGKNILKPEEEKANPGCDAFIRYYVLSQARKYSNMPLPQRNRIQGKIGEWLCRNTLRCNGITNVLTQIKIGGSFVDHAWRVGNTVFLGEVKTGDAVLSLEQALLEKSVNAKCPKILAQAQKKFGSGVKHVKYVLKEYKWLSYSKALKYLRNCKGLKYVRPLLRRIAPRLIPGIGYAMLAYDVYCIADYAYDKYQKHKSNQINSGGGKKKKTERVRETDFIGWKRR